MAKTPKPTPPGSGRQGRGPRSLHRGARVVVRESGAAGGQRAQGQEEEVVEEAATDHYNNGGHDDDGEERLQLHLQESAGVGEQIQGCSSELILYKYFSLYGVKELTCKNTSKLLT